MHLFNLNDFGNRYGIDLTVTDFYDAVVEASKAATASIAARFRYETFDAFTGRRDIFQPYRMFGNNMNEHMEFRLTRGFIDGTTGFSAYMASSPLSIRNGDSNLYDDLQNVAQDGASNMVYVNEEAGVGTLHNVDLRERWVAITYNGGLSVATDDEYENVPSWLEQAAMAQTILSLKENKVFQSDEAGADDLTGIKKQLVSLEAAHSRYNLSASRPHMTELNVS